MVNDFVNIDRTNQQFRGIRYIDDAVARRTHYNADGDYDDQDTAHTYSYWYEDFFYDLTDAQFSVVGLAKGDANAVIAERITYSAYGEARHHWGADLNGDGAVSTADQTVLTGASGTSIGDANYVAEADLNHDGTANTADQTIYNNLSNGGSAIAAQCCPDQGKGK